MIEPLDDALNALICDVASPLAGNLGETVQATERGLRIGVIELVKMLQRQSADSQFFDLVIELVDHYRRTNDDATAEAYFSPASIAAGDSLVEGVFGASRTNLAEEISRAASLQPHAAVCVLNVAAVLLLKSLEPDVSQERLRETSSGSELPEDVSRHSLPQPSGKQGFLAAKSTNDEAPDRKKLRNAKLSWFLLAAATISIVGLAWRLGRDTHSRHENSFSVTQGAVLIDRERRGSQARAGHDSNASSRSASGAKRGGRRNGVERRHGKKGAWGCSSYANAGIAFDASQTTRIARVERG